MPLPCCLKSFYSGCCLWRLRCVDVVFSPSASYCCCIMAFIRGTLIRVSLYCYMPNASVPTLLQFSSPNEIGIWAMASVTAICWSIKVSTDCSCWGGVWITRSFSLVWATRCCNSFLMPLKMKSYFSHSFLLTFYCTGVGATSIAGVGTRARVSFAHAASFF